ncbi:hypothetical protein SeLEV6574_g07144 [Synchytrium endobioticum]|nr:hypothetical protein SeLEV6574_g07144 [Synchytrium endobioticum]
MVESIRHLIKQANSFPWPPPSSFGLPFIIHNQPVGFIRNNVIQHLPLDTFIVHADSVMFSTSISPESWTASIRKLLKEWRKSLASTTPEFECLKGWRHEEYAVYTSHGEVLKIERAAQGIFGIRSYGCHLNGYVIDQDGSMKMWIARRSYKKQTWPGFLDNIVGGGLPAGVTPSENIIKECAEEANIPPEIAVLAKPVSAVSYFMDSPTRGLLPDSEYCYDVQLPNTFIPQPQDGEVHEFFLWDLKKVEQHLLTNEFMPESGLVIIDFLVRHGFITPENEPDYLDVVTDLRRKLPFPAPILS